MIAIVEYLTNIKMAVIVTYDVPSKHTELKDNLKEQGYLDQISGNTCKVIYFPNTTLYHETKTASEALRDVQAVCRDLEIKLERCVSTLWSNYSAICGEDFK